MDPEAALRNARSALKGIREQQDHPDEAGGPVPFGHDDDAHALADAFEALDGWLSKGGYLPQPWSEAGKVGTDV
jgi:hypothetical protein